MGTPERVTSKYGKKWDLYFLRIAKEVGSNSKCLSRQIGSVLVKDKSIVSTGYCGPPRNIPPCNFRTTQVINDGEITSKSIIKIDGIDYIALGITQDMMVDRQSVSDLINSTCPRKIIGAKSGERLDLCIAGHSERNALIQAAREGTSTKGTELYCYCGPPCKDCMIEIINFGVETIVCLEGYGVNIAYYDNLTKYLIDESDIEVIKYDKEEMV